MVIPYRTAKFKSANTFVMAIWDPTAKFNSCQYFQLYTIFLNLSPSVTYLLERSLVFLRPDQTQSP